MKSLFFALCIALLSGCGVLPVAPYNREEVVKRGVANKASVDVFTVEEARLLAAEWRDTLESAGNLRRNEEIVAEEILYYGTLLFAGAQSAIVAKGAATASAALVRARNVGGGMALGSSLFSQHYKVAEQRPVFEKAAARMRCVTDAMADIRPDVRQLWSQEDFDTIKNSDNKLLAPLYAEFPRQVLEFVERRSLPDLRAALSAITLGMPSKAEMAKIFSDYQSEKDKATNAAVSTDNARVMAAPTTAQKNTIVGLIADADSKKAFSAKTDEEIKDEKRKFVAALFSLSANLTICHTAYQQ